MRRLLLITIGVNLGEQMMECREEKESGGRVRSVNTIIPTELLIRRWCCEGRYLILVFLNIITTSSPLPETLD